MSESGRRALLVVNAAAGHAKQVKAAIAVLEAGGMTLVRRETTRVRLDELILSMREMVDCVVIAGGDGVLSAGAIGLRDSGLPLGVLPFGLSNDLAGALGIPTDPAAAAAVILAGHIRPVTLGSVNGRPFFNSASVGISIEMSRKLARIAGQGLGGLRFRWSAFRLLFQVRRFSAIIRCGSTVHRVRTMQVTIGNGRFYRGGMVPPNTLPANDQTLSVYSLEPAQRWGLLFMARVFTGAEGATIAEARHTQSPVVEVVTRLPQPIMADGEVVTVTPARFSLLPQAVRVFVPMGAEDELVDEEGVAAALAGVA